MSGFWIRLEKDDVRLPSKLHFNVHAVSACIYNQCHGRQKMLDHLQQNLKFSQIFKRWLRCKGHSTG